MTDAGDYFGKVTLDLLKQVHALERRIQKLELARAPTPRDKQRRRVYLSDDALEAIAKPLPEIADIERFVAAVFSSAPVKAAFPEATADGPPTVTGKRNTTASAGRDRINIPLKFRNEAVVLHELAHVIRSRHPAESEASHGPEFCQTYLTLAKIVMGETASAALEAAMTANGVCFEGPRRDSETAAHAFF